MLYYALFLFVAFGAKLVLALVMIFLLLPDDERCSECDGETLMLRMGPAGRLTSWLLFRQLQRRWCPHCGWEGLSRPPKREPGPQPVEHRHRTPTQKPT